MSGRDVTAILMGDPVARSVRRPTADDLDRTQYAHMKPRERKPHKVTELGQQVRAMKVGDVLVIPCGKVANNFHSQMMRKFGWTMSVRTRHCDDGTRYAELTRRT